MDDIQCKNQLYVNGKDNEHSFAAWTDKVNIIRILHNCVSIFSLQV